MHEFWTAAFNGQKILPPVDKPREILDIGCGTGIWAVEVAEDNSNSQVCGVDISPVQDKFVPINCRFYLENVLEGLTFHDERFDLIQSRGIGPGIRDVDWPRYIREIWRLTKPGGWIQIIEIDPIRYCDDGSMPSDSPLAQYETIAKKVMKEKYETTVHAMGRMLARHVQKTGFTNITSINVKGPVGKWTDSKYLKRWF